MFIVLLTFGTTDTFAIDDVERVCRINEQACQRFNVTVKPHIHVDAAVGWPLIMFNDYAFDTNPIGLNVSGHFPPHSNVSGHFPPHSDNHDDLILI
ncbi:hypothetical protein [Salinivibrio costicola]|uniref:hypothetical protein n=1 Tax=Salinivibrio costicola TaxID=51367 RepID=UPI000AC85527|nr:hypothetical protein [Salinivibrio costicola]